MMMRVGVLACLLLCPAIPVGAQQTGSPDSGRLSPAFQARPLPGPVRRFEGVPSVVPPQAETVVHRRRGALWGAGIGLVAGGILGGLSVQSDDEDGYGAGLAEAAATGAAVVLGAILGAGLGAVLGATVFAPSTSLAAGHEMRVAPMVAPHGLGLRLHLR